MEYRTIKKGDRILLGHVIPGAPGTLGIVADYPLAAAATAKAEAQRLNSLSTPPDGPSDGRAIQLRLDLR